MEKKIKFRYWNTVTNQMVHNPEMPYKKGWTIEQLFSDRGWIWQQFTGLLDKHGKEIYEGDVLGIKGMGNVIVEWVGQGWSPAVDQEDTEWEVIGNIYESPELLESEDKN